MTIDTLRLRYPGFGFAVYAFEAAGPVTVEAHTPTGEIFTGRAMNETEAWGQLFPDLHIQTVQFTQTEEEAHEPPPEDDIFG